MISPAWSANELIHSSRTSGSIARKCMRPHIGGAPPGGSMA